MNEHLNKVNIWCNANKLTININKTNYMVIKTPRRPVHVDGCLSIGDTPIEGVSSATYLGVSIDPSLTWKSHIDKVMKAISPKVGIISRIRHYVPRSVLVLLYNALILPHLSYCLEIWGNTYPSALNPILLLQKKVARLITFSDYTAHSSPLFRRLRILDIHKLCKLKTCLFVFDLKNNHFAHNLSHYIQDQQPHSYPTKPKIDGDLPVPKVRLSISQHNFKYAAVKHWNSLPVSIKNTSHRNSFKTVLKEQLFHE